MKLSLISVMVKDQAHALKFYTEVLGFLKKLEIPLGHHSWLTVVSPEDPDGPQLLLEPMGFEPAQTYQKALYDAGIPAASFSVNDIHEEHRRLQEKNVQFSMAPEQMGGAMVAVFDDTCGNNIQISQLL